MPLREFYSPAVTGLIIFNYTIIWAIAYVETDLGGGETPKPSPVHTTDYEYENATPAPTSYNIYLLIYINDIIIFLTYKIQYFL